LKGVNLVEIYKVTIENYSKLNDDSIVNIIKTLSKMEGIEEFRVDSEMKFVEVIHNSENITKEFIIKKIDSSVKIFNK
jgi:hypothetical protein